MKLILVSTAAAFLVAIAPCSALAADIEPASQDAATGGATPQTVTTENVPAIPGSVCTAPPQYCPSDATRDALNRAVFLPRQDDPAQPDSSVTGPRLPQAYRVDDSERYAPRNSENWRSSSASDRVDRFMDEHLGGFGRMEVERPGYKLRFDYIYTRRCKVKGVGVCMSVNF